jgi:hypothetical protein
MSNFGQFLHIFHFARATSLSAIAASCRTRTLDRYARAQRGKIFQNSARILRRSARLSREASSAVARSKLSA